MAGNSGHFTNRFQKEIGYDRNMGERSVAKEGVRDAMAAVPTNGGLKKNFSGTEQPKTMTKRVTGMKTMNKPMHGSN